MPTPTIGAAILLSNCANGGWSPPALLLTSPLVLLRFGRGISRLMIPGGEAFFEEPRQPLELLEEVLERLRQFVPKAGPGAGKPSFPLAAVAATYEFGRNFTPHAHCFPHAEELQDDEFFAAIYIDAYRPDSQGATERLGYSGKIPKDWMPGAPALATAPYGHEAPLMTPHEHRRPSEARRLRVTMEREEYEARFKRVQEYLAAGDIYQANLTLPLKGSTNSLPEELFDLSLKRGGASYGMTFLTPTGTILSFSPELYLRRRGQQIETRPIKGTRLIPSRMDGLAAAQEDLMTSKKERAEHLMIVDLERNDLGRLCEPGSVTVEPFMQLIEHPTILHLESAVKGRLREDVRLTDLFAATFPGGSVTGAPKKRALEILAELETGPRGIYCGAMGWIDCEGDCELNLPIRTAVIRPDGSVEYHAGGGIVADSQVGEEWQEIQDKASFFRQVMEGGE